MKLSQTTIPVVYAEYHTTGKHGGTDAAGLHEIIIARQRVQAAQEELIIHRSWPEWAADSQQKTCSASEEYSRLLNKYGHELVEGTYGKPHEGRFQHVCHRIKQAFDKGMALDRIIQLGDPSADFMELQAEDVVEKQAERPAPKIPVDPDGEIGKQVPHTDAPEGVKELGAEEDDEDEPTIDGDLVTHLSEDRQWPEHVAIAVARLVLKFKGNAIPDEDMKDIRELKTPAPLKAMRAHLQDYAKDKLAAKA